tara:strand:+ start:1789 stop:3432 length:1644 start_codon:yes stop_codon:yes gene_type:complete
MELNQLLEGSNNYKSVQADAARLADKWTQSGLLEGYTNEIEKNNMAMILENQAKQIVSEQSNTGAGGSFSAGTGEQWAGVALPLVRKVFAQISAKDFVSVQPMNLPSGLVFFLDFKYGSAFSDRTVGENMYGNVSTANSKMAVDTDVSGGLYGAGAFGYSSKSGSIGAAALSFHAVTQSATSQSIGYQDGTLPSDYAVVGHTFSTSDEIDLLGVRAFQFVSGSDAAGSPNAAPVGGFVTKYPQWTRIATETSPLRVEFTLKKSDIKSNPLGGISGSIFYYKQPADNTRGDFEDNPAGSIAIPEINVELASESIVAKTKKLKAQWTPEFAQDLNAYHSIDAEAELTSLLSEYISMEIDLEILDMLIQDAATTEKWSAENNKVWNGSSFVTTTSDFYNTQGQWFQTLGTKIQKVSNKIHQKTLRGGANFLVCSPTVATILESIPGYAASTDGDKQEFAFGVQKVGQLNGRYKVYKNPYMTENSILLGYRGSQFLETGAVYAPYVPLMMTPLVYDPKTFTPRKGIMTRYAKKMLRPEFYGRIYVSNLDTI